MFNKPTDISDRDLCIWAWVTPDGRFQTQTAEGCWIMNVLDPEDDRIVVDCIRVPTLADSMPDFTHPDWPAARAALTRLREQCSDFLPASASASVLPQGQRLS